MFLTYELSLTESLANIGKSNFESILREELRREHANLQLESFIREGGAPDGDSVEIRIERVERVWESRRINISVHVLFDEIVPSANAEVTRSRREGRLTVVLDPEADGRKRPRACHVFDTRQIYGDEDEVPPMPSEEEETELAEELDSIFSKLEASIEEVRYPADVRKFICIVEREAKHAHRERMQSFLADLRRRLDILPRFEGDDA